MVTARAKEKVRRMGWVQGKAKEFRFEFVLRIKPAAEAKRQQAESSKPLTG
jgi:hypothetical protein